MHSTPFPPPMTPGKPPGVFLCALFEPSKPRFVGDNLFFEQSLEGVADAVDLPRRHPAEKREGERAGCDIFADGEIAFAVSKLLHHIWLKMNGREIIIAANAVGAEGLKDLIAV